MKSFAIIALLLSLASCGGKDGSSHDSSRPKKTSSTPSATPAPTPTTPEEPEAAVSKFITEPGTYNMTFKKLNKRVSNYSAEGSLILSENAMSAKLVAYWAAPLRTTIQGLYEGECPTSADDRNGDGYIDIQEASVKLGRELIVLDNDLNTTDASVFPKATILGRYTYNRAGTNSVMLDQLTKKYGVMNVDLENSVVLVQGIPKLFRLPASVESADSKPVADTLPVACATISKSTN